MIDEKSQLWQYLPQGQRSLIREGYYLLEDSKVHSPVHPITDYSYLAFPFAKAYEGFLKQLFFDIGFIEKWQYESDHFRIGKVLSPNLVRRLRDSSIYMKLTERLGNSDLADDLWRVWKRGRNLIFHYFPHNLSAISLAQAEEIINEIVKVMQSAVLICQPPGANTKHSME